MTIVDQLPTESTAIRVDSVSKRFCRSLKRSLYYGVKDTLHDLSGGSLGDTGLRKDEFWANEQISFQVNRGECVGLIGHNGAGKTTVLKMLNGLIKPDDGSITLNGRVGALIALGAGFNPVLTGRENIYINGAVLGLSRREIHDKLDEIIEFSEIGEFIDSPVRSYSSGMQVRLGFSVATALKPDILLIDEVLAVGDLDFRMKCITRISNLVDSETAVVLVSHSMIDLQRICNRTIVMDHGHIAFDGDVTKGIAIYESLGHREMKAKTGANDASNSRPVSVAGVSVVINDQQQSVEVPCEVSTQDKMGISVEFNSVATANDVRVRVFVESRQYGIITSFSTAKHIGALQINEGFFTTKLEVPSLPLRVGAYNIGVSVHCGERGVLMAATPLFELHVIGPQVPVSAHGDSGMIYVESSWKMCSQDTVEAQI